MKQINPLINKEFSYLLTTNSFDVYSNEEGEVYLSSDEKSSTLADGVLFSLAITDLKKLFYFSEEDVKPTAYFFIDGKKVISSARISVKEKSDDSEN
jgi:hypothetical protein